MLHGSLKKVIKFHSQNLKIIVIVQMNLLKKNVEVRIKRNLIY